MIIDLGWRGILVFNLGWMLTPGAVDRKRVGGRRTIPGASLEEIYPEERLTVTTLEVDGLILGTSL
jgi:hypothetical protein